MIFVTFVCCFVYEYWAGSALHCSARALAPLTLPCEWMNTIPSFVFAQDFSTVCSVLTFIFCVFGCVYLLLMHSALLCGAMLGEE